MWLVRAVVFGGLAMLLLVSIGGRIRADRALDRAAEVATRGTPGEVAAKAQQTVSVWSGRPSVVISVEPEQDRWRAVVMSGPACYELAVGADVVSAHPGLIPCPQPDAAGTDDDPVTFNDPRRYVVVGFLMAWLTGDPTADRYLAAERPSQRLLAENATEVKVTGVFGDAHPAEPGSRSFVTAAADVAYVDRVERLAWTMVLRLDGQRWAIEQLAGGEVPTADRGPLVPGITPPSTTVVSG